MNHASETPTDAIFEVVNRNGSSPIVLICEHASSFIPAHFDNLGLSSDTRASHAAWDLGALAVATGLSGRLDATLVAAGVSRLVYDLNRPPSASGAMPHKSEVFDIPGNAALTQADRAQRTAIYSTPFHAAVAEVLAHKASAVLVTIHSFTPVYNGQNRPVEIGILHDSDTRLADAMMATAQTHSSHIVRRNEPYGPQDGVTHMLQTHGLAQNRANVMIEVRNDLIQTEASQSAIAAELAVWLIEATATLTKDITCKA